MGMQISPIFTSLPLLLITISVVELFLVPTSGMYYAVYGMVSIKEPLLLSGRVAHMGDAGGPLKLLTPYNRKQNVQCVYK